MASKIKQTILSISIALILVLFIGYGISTFYEKPEYEDFCDKTVLRNIMSEEECITLEGVWMPEPRLEEEPLPTPKGSCDLHGECSEEYRTAREEYNKNVFIIAVIAGIIAIFIGVILNLESVSTGIMGGGVLSMLYGTIRYWGDAENILRFIILGIVLVILIWIGYKKLSPEKK